ncbi:Purine nucleoside phosphorylase PunB [Helicobacter sp. NHP19-003]|uniref:Purine nucleoside phosphorylase PunB n=1 Tax=Helicobacter gastrocanis TaxID=2849641 RepID=A0ABM7SIF0_9HELI|nr:purine-nucleoside phosphorylase [Helicobacter sp. NHP19-003]BCZ17868.1 Purine nucleoside phosphorylase PunB [Helicobacter sp. NHP19-003]
MFVCAGDTESFSYAKSVGVGLVQSALNLSRLCMLDNPKEIIFIGTAGSYDPKTPILSLFASTKATQIEESFILGHSYTPLDNGVQTKWPQTLDLPSVVVNSSHYIHTDTHFSNAMCHAGILLENMEFFAVLRVAQCYNVPCFGVFCVTNYTNEHAHRDFIANHESAKERLGSLYQKLKDFHDQ